ncbi:helix-turn-helix transcriptional regulator [Paenibacillus azoreducens]|uniref:HTH cro/C1-type domain-containing protein n=1 Tax=Paenibacillus azoreducens TaxID=116718 RepID=A0A920CT04_9BACL|nr:hypothetical protein J34TS1_27180 [Paenibacillus azoreducens]
MYIVKKKAVNIADIQSNSQSFGGRIRTTRISANLTIRELAFLAGLSPEAISMIENGANCPSLPTLRKLSECLSKPIWYLGCFEDMPEDTLGDRVKKARYYHGYFIEEAAKHLRVDPRSLTNWEKNRTTTSNKYINQVNEFISILYR